MERSPAKDSNDATNAAQRIRELNDINEKIPQVLNSARAAIVALSANPPANGEESSTSNTLENHQEAFTAATRNYFTLVLGIKEALDAQTKALEDAGIIASKAEDEGDGRHMSLGQLDVGWLNERRGDVGRGYEAELMAEAKAVVETLIKETGEDQDQAMTGT